jgi:hypothetical protein
MQHQRVIGIKSEIAAVVEPVEMSVASETAKAVLMEKMVEKTTIEIPTMFSDEPIPMGKICSMDDPTCEACSA